MPCPLWQSTRPRPRAQGRIEVYKDDVGWGSVCGHYFWDNHHGANTLCKQLGFSSGKQSPTKAKFSVDAMPVGKCGANQRLNKCNQGGNAWGNFAYQNGWCKKGTSIGVTVSFGCNASLLTSP